MQSCITYILFARIKRQNYRHVLRILKRILKQLQASEQEFSRQFSFNFRTVLDCPLHYQNYADTLQTLHSITMYYIHYILMCILYSSLFNYNKHTINKTNDFLAYSYSALLTQFLHIIKLLPQSTGTKLALSKFIYYP